MSQLITLTSLMLRRIGRIQPIFSNHTNCKTLLIRQIRRILCEKPGHAHQSSFIKSLLTHNMTPKPSYPTLATNSRKKALMTSDRATRIQLIQLASPTIALRVRIQRRKVRWKIAMRSPLMLPPAKTCVIIVYRRSSSSIIVYRRGRMM